MLAELARRGISHPNAVAMVKRSMLVQSTDGSGQVERFEVPTWGAVLLSVSFWVAMVAVFFVSDAWSHAGPTNISTHNVY